MRGLTGKRRLVGKELKQVLPRLWRFGMSLSGNSTDAEDLVQAVCVRALERADQYQPGTRFDRWTFSIMASIWKNQIRANRVRGGASNVDAEAVLQEDGGAKTEMSVLASQVLTEMQSLPDTQRVTAILVYIEGFTYREAADALGIPVGTVMSRLAAARRALAHLKGDATGAHADRGASDR